MRYIEYMNSTPDALLRNAEEGFKSLGIDERYQKNALGFLEQWLTDQQFSEYTGQIEYLIKRGYWDYLLDSFYTVIPFGTGGRRGEVGVGPNRINPWTIRASAQGHAQYLINHHGEDAKRRGVAFAYDVRIFEGNQYFSAELPNPVMGLSGRMLAEAAAEVYAANGVKVYLFDDIRTTPELSFAIRYLHAVGGDVFSASHNPPSHNGKKVFDEFGGQLIPPNDEALVEEVTKRVTEIKHLDYQDALDQELIQLIGTEVDEAYIKAASSVSLSKARDVRIMYTPLHGCGSTSIQIALERIGFTVMLDPKTGNPSGRFENVTFNIPNPEVVQSFEIPLQAARKENADILLSSDPDADRIGIMVNHQGDWEYLNGNEISAILAEYVISKRKSDFKGDEVIIKTTVTTNLLREICNRNEVGMIGELLVGFKYVGEEMNTLTKNGKVDAFLMGCEESHGYLAGDYARDKDGVTAAIWLSELAAELKQEGRTLIDYLDGIYRKYGFFRNYLTEIRMLGAVGHEKIRRIQDQLRSQPPTQFGRFTVTSVEDCLNRQPIVSTTDEMSKDVLVFHLKPIKGTISIRVTVRPSGTEPKIKMYFEIGSEPVGKTDLAAVTSEIESIMQELEKAVMKTGYSLIEVDFPDRGFLLFWQLPLDDKLKYFKIEPEIEALHTESDASSRAEQLYSLLGFLGSDPLEKVNKAFQAKHSQTIEEYLSLPSE